MKSSIALSLALVTLAGLLPAQATDIAPAAAVAPPVSPADSNVIAALLHHISVLASDEFEGRAPGTRGDSLAVAYIETEFRRIGLEPTAAIGELRQRVPLEWRRVTGRAELGQGSKIVHLTEPLDLVMRSKPTPEAGMFQASQAVFVGYGLVAPPFGWDDYKSADVRNKVVIMIAGTPPRSAYQDSLTATQAGSAPPMPASSGEKLAVALRRGAAAVIFLHDSAIAGYSFHTLVQGYGGETIVPAGGGADSNLTLPSFFVTLASVREMLGEAGLPVAELALQAGKRSFTPMPIALSLKLEFSERVRSFASSNVVGELSGSDSTLRGEVVVYTAHWDHLGRDTSLRGDQIYNGAVDNAAGVAQLIEIARSLARMKPHPRRSVVFIATTGEESGFFGAGYYVAHPAFPLSRTVAEINLDSALPWGRTTDVINYGPTGTSLDSILAAVAAKAGRTMTADPTPEERFFERSDQYPFAMAGVPAIFPSPGIRYEGRPAGYGSAKLQDYGKHDYHQVSDEVRADWDLSGMAQEVQLLSQVGYEVAQWSGRPVWLPTTMCLPCRAARDSTLASEPRK